MEVPVWRVVADDDHGVWTLVADGLLRPPVESASPGVANDVPRMWNADIESLIHEEFTCSELHQCPLDDNEGTDRFSIAEENFQRNPMGLGLLAEKESEEHPKGLSPRKRGILTENSALCNGSVVPPKRQRLSDVQPMFQTASSKPVQFSVSAMQKARALLGFDEVGPCATYGQEESRPSNGSFQVASKAGEVSKSASTTGDVPGNVKRHDVALNGITNQNAKGSAFVIQTAARKPVPIKLNKVNMCTSNVDHAFVRYGLAEKSNTNMFLTAREQPISFSRIPMNQAAGEEDLCFPPNGSHLSTLARHVDQHNAEASSCLFQTATGKAVSISESGMLRAAKLLENTETSNVDHNLGLNMFQTARGQPVSVSSTGVKRAAKLLGDENFSFPAERPLSSPPIRFVTAVGKSVSVSRSAMKRAKDLLGADLENTEITTPAHLVNKGECNSQQLFETPEGHLIKVSSGSIERARLLLKDGAAFSTSSGICPLPVANVDINSAKGADTQELFPRTGFKTWQDPCVRESNFTSVSKKGAMPRKSIALFKPPRRLQPVQPAASSSYCKEAPIQQVKYDFSQLVNLKSLHKKEKPKSSLEEYFRQPPHQEIEFRHLTNDIKRMTSETAKAYKFSSTIDGLESIGSDKFRLMLLEIGANSQVVTKEWVDNHYRWIVWKLASLERSYPSKVANKLLTIQTVFDELKYRYEREGGCAHRSAFKRITEGDSVAGRMMIICVAAVCIKEPIGTNSVDECSALSGDPQTVHVEVTDGWYSLIAHLDPPLIRQFKAGKVFIGQKLRVCGATLLGCTTPLPPLEAFQVMKLALHINGTYRAHWMDKLGLCKGMPMPLAFQCIKPDGGIVPRTIIGIHRIYPVLYHERLPNKGSITRSARAENSAVRGYHDRRNQIAEDAVLRTERECMPHIPENEMDEGAKIFQLLENSAEPELLMADMSAAQLAAFAAYQAKREAARQSLAQKNILKALGEVQLDAREVTSFMKVSVMGLSFLDNEAACKGQTCSKSTKGGIVTIWHVIEEQVDGLKEGAVYCVSNLSPLTGRSIALSKHSMLHLRATKSSNWQLLPQATFSGYTPRKALPLPMIGTLPFRSEFDVAVLIVHVGKPYACGFNQRQWVFASDGSLDEEFSKEPKKAVSLLAIDLSTSSDSFLPVERALEGCIIGYCNLIKRCRDQKNSMWVAEASDSSIFSSHVSTRHFLHLKAASENVKKWAKSSERLIAELEERIHKAVAGES